MFIDIYTICCDIILYIYRYICIYIYIYMHVCIYICVCVCVYICVCVCVARLRLNRILPIRSPPSVRGTDTVKK